MDPALPREVSVNRYQTDIKQISDINQISDIKQISEICSVESSLLVVVLCLGFF